MLVSSAKSMVSESQLWGRSFMYVRNNRGPNMEPWGTPDSIVLHVEALPFSCMNWDLFDK